MAGVFPLINGTYFSFQDITWTIDGLHIVAFKSLNYKEAVTRQWVRGSARLPLGLTSGRYAATGDFEVFLNAASLFTTVPGWAEIPHVMTVTYGPNVIAPLPLTIDTLAGCWFEDVDSPNTEGEEGLTRKFTFKIMNPILRNGIPMLIDLSTIGAVA